jgi:putative membrane protein
MKNTLSAVVATLALVAAPAFAQSVKTPPPSKTAGASVSHDQAFAKEAAGGGMAEVELGNLAKDKASNADVKKFAERMVTDHSKAGDDLKQVASQKNISLPMELSAKDKALRDRLSKLSGDAFDKAYMQAMVKDHVTDVNAFKRESSSGKDADLKAWAGKTLPTLEDHLSEARKTANEVGAAVGTSGKTPKTPKQ